MGNVVGLLGGLGNQLFQYAFGRWLEAKTGTQTLYDLSSYRSRPDYYGLAEIGLEPSPSLAWLARVPYVGGGFPRTAVAVRRVAGPRAVRTETQMLSLPSAKDLENEAWYYGYWQYPEMVNEVISGMRDQVQQHAHALDRPFARIDMHVRRGDMIGHAAELDADYYMRALDVLRSAHDIPEMEPVCIFSDDPDWCRIALPIPSAVFMERSSAAEDLSALSAHEFLVLSGSTFSWWAAVLRERDRSSVSAPYPFVPGSRAPLEMDGWLGVPR